MAPQPPARLGPPGRQCRGNPMASILAAPRGCTRVRARRAAPARLAAPAVVLLLPAWQGGGGGEEASPPAPRIVASTASLRTVEGGERVAFTVQLGTSPSH